MNGQSDKYELKPVGHELMFWAFKMFDRVVSSLLSFSSPKKRGGITSFIFKPFHVSKTKSVKVWGKMKAWYLQYIS